MTNKIAQLNELFNIPEQTPGEYVTTQIKYLVSSGIPLSEGDGWVQIRDWLIGISYEPELDQNVFYAPRSELAKNYVKRAIEVDGEGRRIAHAMCWAESIIHTEGPLISYGMGILPMHFILDAIEGVTEATGIELTPQSIVCMASDFAVLGVAVSEIIRGVK